MSKAVSIEGPAVNTVATAETPATTEARNTAVANIFVAVPSIERSTALLRPLHLCSFPQPVTSKSNTVGAPLNCRAFKCGAPLECGKKLPSQFPSLGYGCRTHVGPAPLKRTTRKWDARLHITTYRTAAVPAHGTACALAPGLERKGRGCFLHRCS